MKKVILPMLFFAIAFVSCSKKESDEQTININDLPKSVISYIDNNYPAESIYEAVKVNDKEVKYTVTLTSDEKIEFDHNGGFIREGNMDLHHNGHKGHHHHGKGHHHDGIPSDSLSAAITEYISVNFAGYTIRHGEKDSICSDGIVTEVMIFNSDSPPTKLYFNSTDSYLMQGSRVLSSDLPQAVKEAIASNYTGYSLTEKSEKYTLADNYTVEYFIFLYQGETHKQLIIKEDGTVVCEQ